jgi:hypothetical protein
MPRFLGRILCWAAVPVLLVAAAALARELFRALWLRWDAADGMGPLMRPGLVAFAGGLGFRFLFHALWRRLRRSDPLEFIDTLEHELTHALVGYLTLSPPVSLTADLKGGGEVKLRGSNPLAALSPYFLPLWCLLAAAVGLVVQASIQGTWDILVFGLLGSFAWRLGREYGWRQSDLHVYGFAFSTAAVALLLLLSVGLVLAARGCLEWSWMARGLPEAWGWLRQGWEAARGLFRKPG